MRINPRMCAIGVCLHALVASIALPRLATCQYIFIDVNNNNVSDSGDVLSPSGPTTLHVVLQTNANRDGSAAFCPTANGPMTLRSYEISLGVKGGTVSWGTFVNMRPEFTTSLGSVSSPTEFYVGYSGPELPAGTYLLGVVTVSIASDNPDIRFLPFPTIASSLPPTRFGAACHGFSSDNLLKLGSEWHDADAVRSVTRWVRNGFALSHAGGNQATPSVTVDGPGNTITVWSDDRAGGGNDIYAQKVSNLGPTLWAPDGVPVSISAGDQSLPEALADGTGNVIVAWQDTRAGNLDIYAQKVDTNGAAVWDTAGVAICTAPGAQVGVRLISDGAGGAILSWEDQRVAPPQVYAQRVSSAGAPQWTTNGIKATALSVEQRSPHMTTDGAGGAILCWEDFRFDPLTADLFAQRLDASGTRLWLTDGNPVVVFPNEQRGPTIVTDGQEGAVVAWGDSRGVLDTDIFAQRLDGNGTRLWSMDGVVVASAGGDQKQPIAVSDTLGGAIVAWSDYRLCAQCGDIFIQRVLGANGGRAWADSGIAVCTAINGQSVTGFIQDGEGGGILAWDDARSDASDIYAQRITGSGLVMWTNDGYPVCTVAGHQTASTITFDGTWGAIVAWSDFRDGLTYDPYITRFTLAGTGVDLVAAPRFTGSLLQNHPNPFNPSTRIEYSLASNARVQLRIWDVRGNPIATLVDGSVSKGPHEVTWDGRDERGEAVSSGVYFYQLEVAGATASRRMVLLK